MSSPLLAKSPADQLKAGRPLTLAGVPDGAGGLVIADLARAIAGGKNAPAISLAVVCRDGARMAAASRTVAARLKPMSSSHWMMFAIGATLPGATDNDCLAIAARSGTRCRTALTVVRSTAGCSRPVTRARRASVITRCATTAGCGDTRS